MTAKHTVSLTTKDGGTLSFECGEDQNLVDSAADAGITLPALCKAGNCGACHGTCTSGDYDLKPHSSEALARDARDRGEILMCRTHPKGDMTVSVEADAAHLTAGPVPERTCTIVANDDIGGQVHRLVLEINADENGDLGPSFEPGQYMELEIPGTETRRAYSLANAPNWEGRLEFLIRLQPEGKFSTWLKNDAQVGQTINTKGPEGTFVLQPGSLNARRFVAGGTGVAPMFSMLQQMAEFQEPHDCCLYFGVNTEKDLFALGEIDRLKAQLPNLRVEVCVWKPEGDWDGFTGSPVDAFARDLKEDLAKGTSPIVYLCGPPGLVDATESAAHDQGLSQDNIFCERFLPT
ncbi:FAD-binding oxidoreductase [Pseudomonadota bacterium]